MELPPSEWMVLMADNKTWWVVGGPIPRTGRSQWLEINHQPMPGAYEFEYGPYTKAEADAKLKAVKSPITPPSIPNPVSGVDSFLGKLGEASLWIRVGEVALGLILIAVGVAKLTNAVPIATKIAGLVK